jgi:hypothetical protein
MQKASPQKITTTTRVFGERNSTNGQVQDLRLLPDGSGSNFISWNEEMYTYVTLKYPGLQGIFKGELCTVPELSDPQFTEGDDFNNQVIMAKWTEANKIVSKRQEEYRVMLPQCYEAAKSTISAGSMHVMKGVLEYIAIDAEKDPMKLRELARTSHLVAVTGLAVADQRKAELLYYNIKQDAGESFDAFLKRFQERSDARIAAGCHRLSRANHAYDLVQCLNERYNKLSTDLHNNAIMKVQDFPKTIPEVVKIFTNFVLAPNNNKAAGIIEEDHSQIMFVGAAQLEEEKRQSTTYSRAEKNAFYKSKEDNHRYQREVVKKNKEYKSSRLKKEKRESSGSDEEKEEKTYTTCLIKYGGCGRAGHKADDC